MRSRGSWVVGFMLVTAGTMWGQAPWDAKPMDWPYWRGPEMNGISRETGMVERWSPAGENLLWSSREYAGKSTPIVVDGKLYSLVRHKPETSEECEKLICVDAATGKLIWEIKWNVYLSDVPNTRIGWSSPVADPTTGRIYALGVNGYFVCADGKTGETIWSHSMSEEYGLLTTYGGRTNFPIVYEDLVIISGVVIGWGEFAKPNHRFIAFDKKTGETIWYNSTRPLPEDTTYSAPVLAMIDDQMLMVVGGGDGYVYAMQPRTGEIVWKYLLSLRGINGTPLVDGTNVYLTQAEENPDDTSMGAVVLLNGSGKGELSKDNVLWRHKEVLAGRNQPIVVDGRVYVIENGGGLFIYDVETGKLIKKQKIGTVMRGSPVYADGKIYACEANGRCWIFKPDEKLGVKVLHKIQLVGEIQASPIISHGRIYITTTEEMFCIGEKNVTPKATERPAPPVEPSAKGDQAIAHVQIVPVESLVRPGESIEFETRAYNSRGQFLDVTSAEYSVDANGSVSADGKFQADSSAAHVASIVTAKVGDKSSMARVRIVPDLPWKFDFSDGQIPVTWIGARYRHVFREVDGEKLMVKVTTIPKGTRSQSWMGHPDFHDYTIQADVRGALTNDKMPNIGLIAQRYTLDMLGENKELQIRTWPPVLDEKEMAKTIPFDWEPETWYTMKFRAANEGGKAVLKGKVWVRDLAEPDEWTITFEYDQPNTVGSPGLYGNATNAEIFIDNISVVPNQ